MEEEDSTCLDLNLSESLHCKNCSKYYFQRLENPNRIRKTQCERPWQLDEEESQHQRKKIMAFKCFCEFIANGKLHPNQIPQSIKHLSTELEMDFPPPPSSPSCRNSRSHSSSQVKRPQRAESTTSVFRRGIKRFLSPTSKKTPPDKVKQNYKKQKPKKIWSPAGESSLFAIKKKAATPGGEQTEEERGGGSLAQGLQDVLGNLRLNDCFQSNNTNILNSILEEQEQHPPHDNILALIQGENDDLKEVLIEKTKALAESLHRQSILEEELRALSQKLANAQIENEKLKKECDDFAGQVTKLKKNQPSNYHASVCKATYTKLQNASTKFKECLSQFQTGKFNGADKFGRRLLGEILATNPALSFESVENICVLIRAQVLAEIDLLLPESTPDKKFVSFENIAKSSPSEHTFRKILNETVGDIMFQIHMDIFHNNNQNGKRPALFLSCDKGTDGNFIKILSYYDNIKSRVKQVILDVDKTQNDSKSAADAIKFAVKKLVGGPDFQFDGQCTDSGGGGTGVSLHQHMDTLHLCTNKEVYLVGYCCLHTLQLTLSNAVQATIGVGGLEKRNAMQAIHAFYDLQNHMEYGVWKDEWKAAAEVVDSGNRNDDDHKVVKLPAPIMTRWHTVGNAAMVITNELPVLRQIAVSVRNSKASNNALNKIASGILSLIAEPQIVSDITLIRGFHDAFLTKHFEWLQGGDKDIGNTPGFLARHMLTRYFLMFSDLEDLMKGGWENSKDMTMFISSLDKDPMKVSIPDPAVSQNDVRITIAEFQKRKANAMFELAFKSLEKHYKRFCDHGELLFLALFGEQHSSQVVSKVLNGDDPLTDQNIDADEVIIHSVIHGRKINVTRFEKFVRMKVTNANIQNDNAHVKSIPPGTMKLLRDGKDVVTDPTLSNHWTKYKHQYASFPTTTHFVERSVKICNYCSNKSRLEERTSQLAICYNSVHDLNSSAKDEMVKSKASKNENYKNEKKLKARGCIKQVTVLNKIWERHSTIEKTLQENESLSETYEQICKIVKFDTSTSYRVHRQKNEMNERQKLARKQRVPNAIERRTGVDITPAMENRVLFHSVQKDYVRGVEKELIARGMNDFTSLKTITQKKNELKKLVAREEGKNENNIKEIKRFAILSDYDWSPLLMESSNR